MSRLWAVLVACAFVGPALAQEPLREPGQISPFGLDVLRGLCKQLGYKPLRSHHELAFDPSNKMLIVLGDVRWLDGRLNSTGLIEFVNRGGAALLASDRISGEAFRLTTGFVITGRKVRAREGRQAYDDNLDLVWVRPEGLQGPLVGQLRLATNKPSVLEPIPNGSGERSFAAWGRYADGVEQERSLVGWRDRSGAFARGRILRSDAAGRILFLADHSVFTNQMLRLPDTDNLPFAIASLSWLSEKPEGRRTECLFVEDGQVIPNFDVDLQTIDPPPLPPLEEQVPLVNQLLTDFQNDDGFRTLFNENTYPHQNWRWLLAFVVLGCVIAGLVWVMRQRRLSDVAPPPARLTTALNVQLNEQYNTDNVYALARRCVRQAFSVVPHADAPQLPTLAGPQAGKHRPDVADLWRIGFAHRPQPLRVRDWAAFRQRLATITQAAQAGEWRFEPAAK
jgi:hypothetical protein